MGRGAIYVFRVECTGTRAGGYFAVSVKTAEVAAPVAVALIVMVLGDGGRV